LCQELNVVLRALSWLPHTYWQDIDDVMGEEELEDSLTVDPLSSARASGDKARREAERKARWRWRWFQLRRLAAEARELAAERFEFELQQRELQEALARLKRYASTSRSDLRSVHMVPNSFHNTLYLISSNLIVGDLIFSVQNRVQDPEQSEDALDSAFRFALDTYQAKRAGAVAEAIKETFPDQLPQSERQCQQLEARLGEFILAHRLTLQDVV